MPVPAPAPGIADLVALASQLEQDAQRPAAALWRRDRELGAKLATLETRPARQLAAWARMGGGQPDPIAARARAALRYSVLILVLVGLCLGWGAATAVFYYDGRHPVNVVNVLAVLVGLQALLLVGYIVSALRRNLSWLSPAQLASLPLRVFPQELRDRLASLLGAAEAHGRVYGRVQKWALLYGSQAFAVAFNLGVLARFLQLVFFSDLAFAWSTTLSVESQTVHRITSALALPWAWVLADASPSLALVEGTRYFRMEGVTGVEHVEAAQFGGWWPFILLCLIVYGLLPRFVTLVMSRAALTRAVEWTMLHTPGAAAALDRLNHEYVQTRSTAPADEHALDAASTMDAPDSEAVPPTALIATAPRFIVNWAGVPLSDEALSKPFGSAPVYGCGGAQSLDEDRATLREAIQATSEAAAARRAIVVVTKGWEPPMLEAVDFLQDVRTAVGPGGAVTVVPVAVRAGQAAACDAMHAAAWRNRIAAVGDPWLNVAALGEGVEHE